MCVFVRLIRNQGLTSCLTGYKSMELASEVDVCLKNAKFVFCALGLNSVSQSVCVPHPGGHASGGKSCNVVLKINPSNADHVHLVCRVVQRAE